MRRTLWIGLAAFSMACGGTMMGSSPDDDRGTGGNPAQDPTLGTGGVSGPGVVPPEQQDSLDSLTRSLGEVRGLDRAGLDERYPAVFNDELGYAPGDAVWLDLIQSSTLGLNDEELAKLDQHGFVISERQSFANFTYGYRNIYYEDLPVFVSLDSVLYALHRSYDSLLLSVERGALIPTLRTLLTGLRDQVAAADLSATTAADVRLFLEVAAGLLGETGGSADAAAIIAQAEAASGLATVELFGSSRELDFSQYEPRGHYTDSQDLQRYFRAMMWLGRTDFRLVATRADGSRELRRREIEAMLGLASLFDTGDRQDWEAIDRAIEVFVGEPDSMMLPQVQSFLDDLGISGPDELASVSDDEIVRVLEEGRYGMQRIASHVMVSTDIELTLPLNTSFTFMGQRYVIDSHVFSNVVADRVPGGLGYPLRMMPDPLDVAFAALGNNQAQNLLADQLDTYGYSQQLAETRILVDAHEDEYWEGSLYTLWLGALRQISAADDPNDASLDGLPSIARTEPWGRRLLNTQLASWAELRHDTLLYAKQSYTMGYTCEYPDAYVDPYPEAFAAIARFADRGTSMLDALSGSYEISSATNYFARLSEVAGILGGMAEDQRTGEPHSQDKLDFINQAVALETDTSGCAAVTYAVGWYPGLFYSPDDALDSDPTIADVHTQATDESGAIVGRVLHVGTGFPRLMVVTVDSCEGPRAYAGLVSSYFERVTDDFDRLTDERWASEVGAVTPPDVPWMADLVAR